MKDTSNPGRATPATPQLSARGDAITMAISLTVNGTTRSVEAEPDTPLLYVLRNDFELNGAKFGCGRAQCGACAVLINGAAVRSCVMPIAHLSPNEITTLELLRTLGQQHSLHKAFINLQAAQCGYCTICMTLEAFKQVKGRSQTTRLPGCY